MPRFTSWYCVVAWYRPNAARQPASSSGGITPMIGFHSVIDRPDPVSRVAPPTTTSANTTAAVANSQMATGRDRSSVGARAMRSLSWLAGQEPDAYAVKPMKARARKAVGAAAMLVFLIAYALIASTIGMRLPNQWLMRLAYYAFVGTAWGLPLIPLVRWMNRVRSAPPSLVNREKALVKRDRSSLRHRT
jgi:hypothetical protein